MTRPTELRLRAYHVGFGDCVLVEADGEGVPRPWRMLVDCGTHSSSGGPSPDALAQAVIDDLGDPPELDVVVATHRHRDHIAGFASTAWAEVQVGEVWLPWPEHPDDPTARDLAARQEAMARAVHRTLSMKLGADDGPVLLALNSTVNQQAMRTLRSGFAGEPVRRYLPETEPPCEVPLPGLAGGKAHLLGPARDRATLRAMEPPSRAAYLALAGAYDDASLPPPMAERYRLGSLDELASRFPEVARRARPLLGRLYANAQAADAFAMAAWLDGCINNTSLFLVLEVRGHRVVLPGDAQWGPWRASLADPARRELLDHATVLKLSHHGSYNGTPREMVEQLLGADTTSLVSVKPVRQWPSLPKPELLAAIAERAPDLVRTDQPLPAVTRARRERDRHTDIVIDLTDQPTQPAEAPARRPRGGRRVR